MSPTVGQIIDCAANAVAYRPPERLRATYESACDSLRKDSSTELRMTLGEAIDPEEFWEGATTNSGAGRLRLIFVADEIPAELRRIIEFLNNQMDPAEVLGIDIKQFVGNGLRHWYRRSSDRPQIPSAESKFHRPGPNGTKHAS